MKKLEVKKDDLRYNLNLIKQRIRNEDSENNKTQIIAIVKANGMGLGLVEYTKFLIEEGINFFGVSNTFEALELRKEQITQEILMMSEVINEDELTELIKNDIILTVGNLEQKKKINSIAQKLDKKVRVHIKIDTGFSRYRFYL